MRLKVATCQGIGKRWKWLFVDADVDGVVDTGTIAMCTGNYATREEALAAGEAAAHADFVEPMEEET